jgi:hypothetical protein
MVASRHGAGRRASCLTLGATRPRRHPPRHRRHGGDAKCRSSPVTCAVNGRQYVAVPVGWGGWLEGFAPESHDVQRTTTLVVFALP